jgi:hypothetical protein
LLALGLGLVRRWVVVFLLVLDVVLVDLSPARALEELFDSLDCILGLNPPSLVIDDAWQKCRCLLDDAP